VAIAFDARYVNDQYHGIGRHAFHLVEALTRLDTGRSYVVFFDPSYPNSRFDLAALGRRANVRLRPVRLPLYSAVEQLYWPLILARTSAELFHTPYVALPLLARSSLIMTVHDLIFERFPDYMPQRWLRRIYRTMVAGGVRRAASVLTVSEATRRDLETFYPAARGKTVVVGNAVDPTIRREVRTSVLEEVRKHYRLPDRFVLALGAGRPHKNLRVVVEAFGLLDPAVAPALVLAGEWDRRFEDDVSQVIRSRTLDDRVLRPGGIREQHLPALYTLADTLVFPSIVEGFGLPMVEAMACGTPVLASNVSSMPEVAGDAALTFDPRDPVQLADCLRTVLEKQSLRADLSRRGLARAKRFDWDGVAQATLSAYSCALSRTHREPATR
jgi:glycosyltransferase involved in cell wall biosynthesis